MNIPQELRYTKSHEWIKTTDGVASIGLTDYAQKQLGDLVFVNMPEVGDEVVKGETFSDVESVKAVSDVYSPISGTIAEINEELLDNPALINEDPYDAWFVKVENITDEEELMDATAYAAFCEEEIAKEE